jgi:hypothetical protein
MAKITDNNFVLEGNEAIKFPNSQIGEVGGTLNITGNVSVTVTKIKGIEVDISSLPDQGVLAYDAASGKLKFVAQ